MMRMGKITAWTIVFVFKNIELEWLLVCRCLFLPSRVTNLTSCSPLKDGLMVGWFKIHLDNTELMVVGYTWVKIVICAHTHYFHYTYMNATLTLFTYHLSPMPSTMTVLIWQLWRQCSGLSKSTLCSSCKSSAKSDWVDSKVDISRTSHTNIRIYTAVIFEILSYNRVCYTNCIQSVCMVKL